jgi:hypothetical protein
MEFYSIASKLFKRNEWWTIMRYLKL